MEKKEMENLIAFGYMEQLDKYKKRLQKMSIDDLWEERTRLYMKMNVDGYFITPTQRVKTSVNFANDSSQLNRLFLRKKIATQTKWINFVIDKSKMDFSEAWKLINALFVSSDENPNYKSELLNPRDISFLNTLSLSGLTNYRVFLTVLANCFLFDDKTFDDALCSAKNAEISMLDGNGALRSKYIDNFVLCDNWETCLKNAYKTKILNEYIRTRNLDVKEDLEK